MRAGAGKIRTSPGLENLVSCHATPIPPPGFEKPLPHAVLALAAIDFREIKTWHRHNSHAVIIRISDFGVSNLLGVVFAVARK
jgi:hypothetical protein